jgi:hypothetical protein
MDSFSFEKVRTQILFMDQGVGSDSDDDDMYLTQPNAQRCNICGSTDFALVDGLQLCQGCGTAVEGYASFVEDHSIGFRQANVLVDEDKHGEWVNNKLDLGNGL